MKIYAYVSAFTLTSVLACAQTKKVDTELLLLVEVSNGLSEQDFDSMMTSYGKAMQSEAVLSSIKGGVQGSIAASLMFFGGAENQKVAVDWFEISGKKSAASFAERLASQELPFSASSTSISEALNKGSGTFSLSNNTGFESSARIIDITGFNQSTTEKGAIVSAGDVDKAVSSKLLTQGVTAINGLSLGGEEVGSYYSENVRGGKTSFSLTANAAELDVVMAQKISKGIENVNAEAVPEPSSTVLVGMGVCSLLFRRKR